MPLRRGRLSSSPWSSIELKGSVHCDRGLLWKGRRQETEVDRCESIKDGTWGFWRVNRRWHLMQTYALDEGRANIKVVDDEESRKKVRFDASMVGSPKRMSTWPFSYIRLIFLFGLKTLLSLSIWNTVCLGFQFECLWCPALYIHFTWRILLQYHTGLVVISRKWLNHSNVQPI